MKNHHEVLRCYDVLVRSHKEKLVAGLIVRMGSVDENIRLASLTIFKHIMNSSLEQGSISIDILGTSPTFCVSSFETCVNLFPSTEVPEVSEVPEVVTKHVPKLNP